MLGYNARLGLHNGLLRIHTCTSEGGELGKIR
jgi:hypothetical protein